MLDLAFWLPNTAQHNPEGKVHMTQPPGTPDPNSQPRYGQPNPPSTGGIPDSGAAGYGQPAGAGYGEPSSHPSAPPAEYGQAPQGTPVQVTVAAVLGFVVALLTLLATLGFFALSDVSGVFVIFAILYLAITLGLIAGGVMALTGKSGQILLITAAVALGLQILGIIFTLVQNESFNVLSLIGLLLTGGIVFLLLQPQAKQFFASRR